MSKYRICPDCGFHNPISRIECSECEADLTAVPVVDENTAPNITPPAAKRAMIRQCGCGAKNPAAARKCSVCGEDISDIIPAEDTGEQSAHFTLASVDGSYAFELTEPEVTVGREKSMSGYLSGKPFVSRVHAKFETEDGRLFITNLSTTNFTYVNNLKISGRQELSDGDEIGLGGCVSGGSRQDGAAYFIVRICPCS